MSAIVPRAGKIRQLDRPAEPDEQVTEEQVKDVPRLARLLMALLRDVAQIKRRWWPRCIDFEDVDVDATGTTKYRFPHGFGTRVRWYPVDVSDVVSVATAGYELPPLARHADSDDNTLVLVSYVECRVTIRVEVAG